MLHAQSSPRVLARLHVSDDVRGTWARVLACAGAYADSTKRLEDVVFLIREPGARTGAGVLSKGEFVRPDTIYITQGYQHSGWIVAHELLHYATSAHDFGNELHPPTPFMFPCTLYDDPTDPVPEPGQQTARAEPRPTSIGGQSFAYPVLGFAVYIQGTLLAGHGWWRA